MPFDCSSSPLSDKTWKPEYVAVGTIGKSFGLKGECRIFPFGGTLDKIKLPLSLMAGFEKPEITVVLKALVKDAKGYKALFEGYESRESTDSIRNCQLFIERDQLPSVKKHEFYHFELEGMCVISEGSNDDIGTVIRVFNYPTVDALEVRNKEGRTVIVPLTEQVITRIDKDAGLIFVAPAALEDIL